MSSETAEQILERARKHSDHGIFHPMDVATHQTSTISIKRRLKDAGYAAPSGLNDGTWVITQKGGNPLYAGEEFVS